MPPVDSGLIDPRAVEAWMDGAGLPGGAVSVRALSGGKSNLTFLVERDGQPFVLRRPPLGEVAATANDVVREAVVLRALSTTDVPTPRLLGICDDVSMIGAPFVMMSYLPGRTIRRQDDLAAVDGQLLAGSITQKLALIHSVDPDVVGLGAYRRRPSFAERQYARWRKQLHVSVDRPDADLLALIDRLGRSLPEDSATAIVHGDYKLDNFLLDSSGTTVEGIVDWEMWAIGDPLSDLGLMAAYWDGVGDLVAPGTVIGFPRAQTLIDLYEEQTRRNLGTLSWHRAFAYFKLAAIAAQLDRRHRDGHSSNALRSDLGVASAELSAAGLELLRSGHRD